MRRIAVPAVLVMAALATLWLVGRVAGEPLLRVMTAIEEAGPAAPLLFTVVYIVAVVALVPGSILTVAAGAMFGLATGVTVVFVGATIGSALAFQVARHAARPRVERRLKGDPRFGRISEAVGRQGFRIVLLLRLTPLVPFNLLNYALGLSPIRFADYLLASVGMLPGTILYVYSGMVAGELTAAALGSTVPRGPGWYLLVGTGLVATALLVTMLTRMAREALRMEAGFGTLSEESSARRRDPGDA